MNKKCTDVIATFRLTGRALRQGSRGRYVLRSSICWRKLWGSSTRRLIAFFRRKMSPKSWSRTAENQRSRPRHSSTKLMFLWHPVNQMIHHYQKSQNGSIFRTHTSKPGSVDFSPCFQSGLPEKLLRRSPLDIRSWAEKASMAFFEEHGKLTRSVLLRFCSTQPVDMIKTYKNSGRGVTFTKVVNLKSQRFWFKLQGAQQQRMRPRNRSESTQSTSLSYQVKNAI